MQFIATVALKLLLDPEVDLRQLSRFCRADWACENEDDGTTASFNMRRVQAFLKAKTIST